MYNLTSVNQAQWQALIDAIGQGGGGGGGTASSVSYDNTTSHLTAITVQGAIDEVSSDLDTAIEDIDTNTQAINELNSNLESKLTVLHTHNLNSNNPITINATGVARFKIHLFGANNNNALLMGYSSSSSNFVIVDINKGSNISYTPTTGTLTITSATTSNSYVYVEVFEGLDNISIS